MSPRVDGGRRALIGGLLIAGIVVLAALSVTLGDLIERRRGVFTVVAVVEEAGRVKPGTPVWLAGHPAGEVRRVSFLPPADGRPGRLAITMVLPRGLLGQVRADAAVALRPDQPLGPPVVRLDPGTPDAPPLGPVDTLFALDREPLEPVVTRARSLVGSLDSLTDRLHRLSEALDRQEVSLAGVEGPARAAAGEVRRTRNLLSEGPLGALPTAEVRERIAIISDRVTALGAALDTAAMAWKRDDLEGERLAERLAATRRELGRLEAALAGAEGTAGRVLHDTALTAAVARSQAALDSLMAELSATPWRLFF